MKVRRIGLFKPVFDLLTSSHVHMALKVKEEEVRTNQGCTHAFMIMVTC